jgi:hypothetical protein
VRPCRRRVAVSLFIEYTVLSVLGRRSDVCGSESTAFRYLPLSHARTHSRAHTHISQHFSYLECTTKAHSRTSCEDRRGWRNNSSTSSLGGVGRHHHAPAALTPGNGPVPSVQVAGWVRGPVWMGAENFALSRIRSPTVQPVASLCTNNAVATHSITSVQGPCRSRHCRSVHPVHATEMPRTGRSALERNTCR